MKNNSNFLLEAQNGKLTNLTSIGGSHKLNSGAASDYKKMVDAYRNRDTTFGNARYVNTLIDESKMNMGLRLMQSNNPETLTNEELSTIQSADIERIFEGKKKGIADIPIDEDLLKQALITLHHLIGLESVKNEIDELVNFQELGHQRCRRHAIAHPPAGCVIGLAK